MIRKALAALFFIGLMTIQSAALAAEPLDSLRSLIVLGLKNNLGLEIERQDVLQDRESVVIEESVFDSRVYANSSIASSKRPAEPTTGTSPEYDSDEYSARLGIEKQLKNGLTLDTFLSTQYLDDDDLSSDLDPATRTSFTIELTQPLLRNFGHDINLTQVRIADNQSRQTALSYLLNVQNLSILLESAVLQLAGEARIVGLRREALGLAEELLSANKKRFEAGLVPVTEVLEAETALANRQLSLSQSQEQYELHRQDLSRQLHIELSSSFDPAAIVAYQLNETFDHPDISNLFSEAKSKRLEFKVTNLALENSLLNRRYLENQGKPQLDLTAKAGLSGLSGSDRGLDSTNHYNGSWLDSYSSMGQGDGYDWGVGLNFSLPLGNRAAKARIRQADYQYRQQSYRQRDLEVQVKDELQQQGISLARAFEQLKLAERFAELARTSLDQEQRRLDEGLSDTFRMISFQDNMINARIGEINALTRLTTEQARLDFLRGGIFERHGIVLTENLEEIDLENI